MSREWIIDDDFLDEETKLSADGQGYLTELVRCKDCRWWRDIDHTCKYSFTSPMCANDYCSYGKRADA